MTASPALWSSLASGDETARQQLLTEHVRLVRFVARKVARHLPGETDFDELVSAGTLGLIQALDAFDASRGLTFSTFAAPRIRGAILDELRRQDPATRSVRRKVRDLAHAREALRQREQREPSQKEVAAHLSIDLPTLWRWETDAMSTSFVSPTREDGKGEQFDALVSDEAALLDEALTQGQDAERLRLALATLGERERVVLSLYYYEELKLHEIATILGITESRVSQIRSKAIGRLRAAMGRTEAHVA